MSTQRLDKIIADSGLYTRSEARALIKLGRVEAGGCVAKAPAELHDPEQALVKIDGAQLDYKKFRYIMMNKPCGVISSTADRHERTVMELLDAKYSKMGLFPVGRLDKDAEGFLLLTNDGALAHKIASPSSRIGKRYFAEIDGAVTVDDIKAFNDGFVLGDGTECLPAILENTDGGVFITLYEGKYHQVKRMMAALGKPVKYLKRVSIGGLQLDESLNPGEYCEIGDEISQIKCEW